MAIPCCLIASERQQSRVAWVRVPLQKVLEDTLTTNHKLRPCPERECNLHSCPTPTIGHPRCSLRDLENLHAASSSPLLKVFFLPTAVLSVPGMGAG